MDKTPPGPSQSSMQCRLCLHHAELMVSLFGDRGREADMGKKIYLHLNITVNENDYLPQHICLKCWHTVEIFDSFFKEVNENQAQLVRGNATPREGTATIHYFVNDVLMGVEDVDPLGLLSETEKAIYPSPPTYDEAQKTKQATLTVEHVSISQNADGTMIQIIKTPNEENVSSGPTNEEQEKEISNNGADTEDTESDDTGNENPTEGAGILGRVDGYEFPEIIRNGKVAVRGEVLDRCLVAHYGVRCEICQEQNWTTMDDLFTHYREAHGREGFVNCCGRKIVRRSQITMHMAKHVQPAAFECPECKKMMTTPRILQLHIQNHRPENERPLKCKLCPRRFSYVSALLIHASTHRMENDEQRAYYMCEDCGRAYRSEERLAAHVSSSHHRKGCVTCETCGKTFLSKSNLNYHMTTHQPKVHQVQCDHCGKWLKNKLCLRKHMLQHSQVQHRCGICDYTSTNVQSLNSHVRVQHTDVKPFGCPTCGKSFKLKGNLREHLSQHLDEKQYSCEFCSRRFTSKSNYYAHRKRMHLSELNLQNQLKEHEERAYRIKLKLQ